jgi:SsrA-binding protein
MKRNSQSETLIENKRARVEYEFLETFDAGIELLGHEVKTLRGKRGSLTGSRVVVRGGEAFLVSATIPVYQENNVPKSYDPERPRRLLLTKKEIVRLASEESKGGLTIVPLWVYNKGTSLKLSFALARKRKGYDKRELLKKRSSERDVARITKHGRL